MAEHSPAPPSSSPPPAKPTVYIETTVVSYLTAWPSRNIKRAADQLTTRDWWDTQRGRFELRTSELVILEARAGDVRAAEQRLAILDELMLVDAGSDTDRLARALVDAAAIPAVAARDALHVALAAVNGIDYVLTWNCKHLANAALSRKIRAVCESLGFAPPVIATPNQLFEETEHGAQ